MNLDDELNRLFADERLALPVAEDAERRVQAGIRRRRQRRGAAAAAVGALVAAGVVFSGSLLAPDGGDRAEPPPNRPKVSTSAGQSTPAGTTASGGARVPSGGASPPLSVGRGGGSNGGSGGGTDGGSGGGFGGGQGGGVSAPTQPGGSPTSEFVPTGPGRDFRRFPAGPVVGPTGFGPLSLGMSEQAARGYLVTPPVPSKGSCTLYQVKGYSSGATTASAAFTRTGLVAITVHGQAHTPEGVGTGSPPEDIRRVYPGASIGATSATAPVPGNRGASYRFDMGDNGRITSFALTSGSCG
jgi:hypothetical protein